MHLLTSLRSSDIINTVAKKAPNAKFMFNYNPTSSLEAVRRGFPVGDCTNRPGANYGETIICSVCPPGTTLP